ncbi:MAG: hypothetical protein ACTHW1_02005 [Ancrocorticia sp.]|uniref:hypothetical protein n=1 Tax=Ancrocorticia sp. TaxID=2593684 RepID=UPI003F9086C2
MFSFKKAVATAASVALVLGLAACGDAEESETNLAKVTGINPNAELDYDTGIVYFPAEPLTTLDRDHDMELISSAGEGVFSQCVFDKTGTKLDPYPIDREEPIRDVFFIYGPWTKPIAEKFAFVLPMTDGELTFNGYVPRPEGFVEPPSGNPYAKLTQEERDEYTELCGSEPEYTKYNLLHVQSTGPGEIGLQEVQDKVAADRRTKDLVDELDKCFAPLGLEADPDRIGLPKEADVDVINEDQLDMAMKTVECKDEIDFTQRLADIIAEYQMKVIDEYGAEMTAERDKFDALVQEAEDFIAANPDLFVQY